VPINKAQDITGIPVASIIYNRRSAWILLPSMLPVGWPTMDTEQLSRINYAELFW